MYSMVQKEYTGSLMQIRGIVHAGKGRLPNALLDGGVYNLVKEEFQVTKLCPMLSWYSEN